MGSFKIRGIIMRLGQWDGLPSISSKIGLLELGDKFSPWAQLGYGKSPLKYIEINLLHMLQWWFSNICKIMELNLLRMFTINNQFHFHQPPRAAVSPSPGSPASPGPLAPSTASECSQRSCRADPICCREWSWPCPCNLGSWWSWGSWEKPNRLRCGKPKRGNPVPKMIYKWWVFHIYASLQDGIYYIFIILE